MMKTLGHIEELLFQKHSNTHQYTVTLLLERLLREALNSLTQPNEIELSDNVKVFSQLAKKLQYGLPDTKEVKTAAIAASLQVLASLCQLALQKEIPLSTKAILQEGKYVLPILKALRKKEFNLTELASQVGIQDPAQMSRTIKPLTKHKLVETAKEGKERWVRLTELGRRAIEEFNKKENMPTHAYTTTHVYLDWSNEKVEKKITVSENLQKLRLVNNVNAKPSDIQTYISKKLKNLEGYKKIKLKIISDDPIKKLFTPSFNVLDSNEDDLSIINQDDRIPLNYYKQTDDSSYPKYN